MQAWEGSFFVVMCQVTLDQDNMLSNASCEEMTAVATHNTSPVSSAEPHLGDSRKQHSAQAGRTKKELSHCLHNL